jgi:hypothetical protein
VGVTVDEFRALALGLPEAVEAAHMGHPDFRVRGKIFATLGPPGDGRGMVKLTAEQQAAFARLQPDVFKPVKGAWGLRGATHVHLQRAEEDIVWQALVAAWRNTAPKRLCQEFDAG